MKITFINESAPDDQMKIFTQLTKVDKQYIDTVFSEGLKCRDNGEAHGTWFSRGRKFYDYMQTFCFSLPYTEESMRIGGFDIYDWENNASVVIAHNNIPIKYLKLEEGILEAYKLPNDSKWGYLFENASPKAERFFRADNVRLFDKSREFVIFRDIFEYLYGYPPNESEYTDILNVSFDNFLFNDKWKF